MLQFSINDTVRWAEKYGNYSDGNIMPSGVFSTPKTTFTGVMGDSDGVVGSNSGFSPGDLVWIQQAREGGDGAGKWQLNRIRTIVTNTFTFKYALQHDFDTKAQIVKINQNRHITINGVLDAPEWDGDTGAAIILMGKSVGGTGTINLKGKGFRGGTVATSGSGHRGEGQNSDSALSSPAYAHDGNAGGGANERTDGAPGGGGGGNATDGTAGGTAVDQAGGEAGEAAGQEDLQILILPGAGGKGGNNGSGGAAGGNGGRAPALLIIIAENIDLSSMTIIDGAGEDGQNSANANSGGGGAAAGAPILLKGVNVDAGTNKISVPGGTGGTGFRSGGNGSVGRIRAEYSKTFTGSAAVTISSFKDKTLRKQPSAGPAVMLLNP